MRRSMMGGVTRVRGATDKKLATARIQRKHLTPGERALWDALRNRKLAGVKFRRIHPIAGFVVDFYAPAFALVVEVDGGVHERQRDEDAHRTAVLEALGLSVIRVRNEEVLHALPTVLERIARACVLRPSRA